MYTILGSSSTGGLKPRHDGDLVATRKVVASFQRASCGGEFSTCRFPTRWRSCRHKKSGGKFSTGLLWRRVFNLPKFQHDGDLVATRAVVPKYNKMKSCCHKRCGGEFQHDGDLVTTRAVVPNSNKMGISLPQEKCWRVFSWPLVEASFQRAEFQHDGDLVESALPSVISVGRAGSRRS